MPSEVHFNFVGKSKMRGGADGIQSGSFGGGTLPSLGGGSGGSRKGISKTEAQELMFQLKQFEDFQQPSFNTLYVQTPRPNLAKAPWLAALGQVIQETGELLEPLTRFGIPKNSLKDKLPYFREDFSPLPNTVRPRVQKVLRKNIQFAEHMSAVQLQAAEEWKQIQKEKHDKKVTVQRRGWRQQPQPQQQEQQQQEQGVASTASSSSSDVHGHGHGSSSSKGAAAKDPANMTWQQYCQAAMEKHRPHPVHISQPSFLTHEMPIFMVPALNIAAYWYLCGMGGLDFFKR